MQKISEILREMGFDPDEVKELLNEAELTQEEAIRRLQIAADNYRPDNKPSPRKETRGREVGIIREKTPNEGGKHDSERILRLP